MANLAREYDLGLFEERRESVVRNISESVVTEPERKKKVKKEPKKNIIELPEKELKKNRKPKTHWVSTILKSACVMIIFLTVVTFVQGQVELTELADQINKQSTALEEAEAQQIQLEMKLSEKMNATDVETYAREELGMSKINENQVTYTNIANEDKGDVVVETSDESWFTSIKNAILSWFD